MELVAKEMTSSAEPTLVNQIDKLLSQQADLESTFNLTSNTLFGAGPYDHSPEVSVGSDISAKLKLLIDRNEELLHNSRALLSGVGGENRW
jgi:hypothetical protein